MALSITCSGCDAVYPVGENLIGKTIRCKKCGEMMPVTAPSKSKASIALDEDEAPRRPSSRREEAREDEAPKARSRRRDEDEDNEDEDEAPKARSRRRDEDEDDEDDRPRRGRGRDADQPKSKKPLLIGSILALVLIAGGVGAAAMLGAFDGDEDDDNPPVAANNINNPPQKLATPPNANPAPETANANAKKPTPPAPAPMTTNTTPKPAPPPPPPPTPMTTSQDRKPEPPTPMPMNSGTPVSVGRGANNNGGAPDLPSDISQLNIARVKRAAVYIKAVAEIGEGSGSGWIGMESDLIFTNAHVLFMKAPNSPEPKKLTVYLNSGTPDQIEIPHSKLKILAVDRDIDLAVIKIIGMPNLPPPLKIRLSAGVRDAETVYTIGFPLGSQISTVVGQTRKEPSVSVRKTTVSGTVGDDYGQIVQMKLEGGINPGNSGGAVVDTNGDVVAVVVAMIGGGTRGNFIGLAIPTEFVNGLVAGRVANLEYGIPYRDKDKVKVPVTAHCLNPFDKTLEIHVRHWIGDVNAPYRVPGNEIPKPDANDANNTTVELKYDPKSKTATGELVYPDAPTGRTYWAQPYFANALTMYRMPGIKVPMNGPPVERVPANLVSAPKIGTRRAVTLSNSSDLTEYHEGEGESKDEKIKIKTTLKVNESVEKPDNTDQIQAAKLRLRFESINLSAEGFGGALQEDILGKKNQEQLNTLIKLAEAYGLLNRFGEMYKYTIGVRGINDPLFNFLVNAMTTDSLEALQATSIPMPNGPVNPGQTWTSTKDLRLYLISGPTTLTPGAGGKVSVKQPKPREYKYRDQVTYTYLGVRERNGRKEAVVQVEGKSIQSPGAKQTVSGSVKGLAWVEIDTGVVVEATIKKEFELDTSGEGAKKRVSGENEYKITRGTAQ
jgi:S1-C subfamily serine protease